MIYGEILVPDFSFLTLSLIYCKGGNTFKAVI